MGTGNKDYGALQKPELVTGNGLLAEALQTGNGIIKH